MQGLIAGGSLGPLLLMIVYPAHVKDRSLMSWWPCLIAAHPSVRPQPGHPPVPLLKPHPNPIVWTDDARRRLPRLTVLGLGFWFRKLIWKTTNKLRSWSDDMQEIQLAALMRMQRLRQWVLVAIHLIGSFPMKRFYIRRGPHRGCHNISD